MSLLRNGFLNVPNAGKNPLANSRLRYPKMSEKNFVPKTIARRCSKRAIVQSSRLIILAQGIPWMRYVLFASTNGKYAQTI